MKRIVTGMALLSTMTCFAQNKLEITGEIAGIKEGEIVYFWRPLGSVTDSTFVKNGKFATTIDMSEGGSTYIVKIGREPVDEHGTFLYLEGGKLDIKGKGPYFKDVVYTGSQFISDWKSIEKDVFGKELNESKIQQLMEDHTAALQVGDSDAAAALGLEIEELQKQTAATVRDWVLKHPNAGAASYLINAYMNSMPQQELLDLIAQLGPNVRNTYTIRQMVTNMTGSGEGTLERIGKAAPGFQLKDNNGKMVSLSDFKGKYVLLDFWASWCKPCRDQNPQLTAVYNKFKDKGFSILSVSIDEDKNKWLKAIAEDKLAWTQVIGEGGPTSKVAKDYKIIAIPATMLIDREGKIVKVGLRSADLEQLLTKLL